MTVRERLTDARQTFTKAEIKVIREMLANYPVGALTTVSSLARRARVSDPTVVRLAAKLGFEGFGSLQQALLAEVEAHLNSPLTILAGQREAVARDNHVQGFLDEAAGATRAAAGEIVPAQFEAAATLLTDTRKRLLCLGGRFSRYLAGILRQHMQQLRPHVELLTEGEAELADRLVDVGARDVLAVYDFRRYQANVVHFAGEAHRRGCRVILVTDRWRSPIAEIADVVFPLPVESSSPFDSMVPALAVTEALIAAAAGRARDLDDRLEAIEHLRADYRAATGAPPPAPARRQMVGPETARVPAAARRRRPVP